MKHNLWKEAWREAGSSRGSESAFWDRAQGFGLMVQSCRFGAWVGPTSEFLPANA